MKIYLKQKSYFTFRGKPSYELDLLGETVFGFMFEGLNAECGEPAEGEECVILEPVYPFLTREELFTFLDEREGSYSFAGGRVFRAGYQLSPSPRAETLSLGRGLFSLADYPYFLSRARKESAKLHLARGALVEDGAEVSFTAELRTGAIVRRGARVLGKSIVGENAEIGSGSELIDSVVGAGTVVKSSTLFQAEVGENCSVGPNAYLRAGSSIGNGCRVGDFVEIKNARIGDGTKIAHLAYVGDATLGKRVNVGCGVIFANYDGRKKSAVTVGDDCFIGSNCNLIAPLTIGEGAFLAAGTTLTQNLEKEDFCIGRCRETVKKGRGGAYYNPKK